MVDYLIQETINQTESQQIKSNDGFRWEEKTEVPGEKPLGKGWRIYKLNPSMTVTESNPGHISERRVLSPLRKLFWFSLATPAEAQPTLADSVL